MDQIYFKSPVGFLLIEGSRKGVFSVSFCKEKPSAPQISKNQHLLLAVRELREYFRGNLTEFSFALDIKGTEFQKKVWRGLQKIRFGFAQSYSDLARMIRKPKASRAVGMANNKNPLPIVIPCHRVIGKDGRLVGYAGGLEVKAWLLRHEASVVRRHGSLGRRGRPLDSRKHQPGESFEK